MSSQALCLAFFAFDTEHRMDFLSSDLGQQVMTALLGASGSVLLFWTLNWVYRSAGNNRRVAKLERELKRALRDVEQLSWAKDYHQDEVATLVEIADERADEYAQEGTTRSRVDALLQTVDDLEEAHSSIAALEEDLTLTRADLEHFEAALREAEERVSESESSCDDAESTISLVDSDLDAYGFTGLTYEVPKRVEGALIELQERRDLMRDAERILAKVGIEPGPNFSVCADIPGVSSTGDPLPLSEQIEILAEQHDSAQKEFVAMRLEMDTMSDMLAAEGISAFTDDELQVFIDMPIRLQNLIDMYNELKSREPFISEASGTDFAMRCVSRGEKQLIASYRRARDDHGAHYDNTLIDDRHVTVHVSPKDGWATIFHPDALDSELVTMAVALYNARFDGGLSLSSAQLEQTGQLGPWLSVARAAYHHLFKDSDAIFERDPATDWTVSCVGPHNGTTGRYLVSLRDPDKFNICAVPVDPEEYEDIPDDCASTRSDRVGTGGVSLAHHWTYATRYFPGPSGR